MSLVQEFIDYLVHEKRFSEHTVIAYKKDLENFLEIVSAESDEEISELSHRDLRSYLVALVESGLENSSVNRKLSSIKTFYRFLRQKGDCDVNPCSKLKGLKKKKALPQFVPESQLWSDNIFDEQQDEFENALDHLMIEMFYQTGIRQAELIGLKENDVSSSKIKVLGKRNKERIIPISQKLWVLIDRFLSIKKSIGLKGEFLFLLKNGKKLS
ncbi:MAG: site-specific integrase [Crocinitomicaceae bacterium]|nr:site-specific integrase [Crocinitomicaceae bacterium]